MKDKLKHVKVSSVIVGDRFREDFGDIEGLKQSIADKGLLQPVTISTGNELLAGGRRFRACQELGIDTIPALVRETDGELDAREIELIENVHRKDFTWQERVRLTMRIHDLYLEKDPKWSMRKTAELIEQSPITVSRAARLSMLMDSDEKVNQCNTLEDALRYGKLLQERAIVEELAKRAKDSVEKLQDGHPLSSKEKEMSSISKRASQDYIIADYLTGLKSIKKGGFNLIECDPPYGIEFSDNADRYAIGTKTNEQISTFIDIDPREYPEFLDNLFKETYRVAAEDCWLLCWFNYQWYGTIMEKMILNGWKPDKYPAIWEKNLHSENGSKDVLARMYEPFIVAKKGHPFIAKAGHSNVFKGNMDRTKYHPTQKPLKLMQEIITTFSISGDKVLVPFAGSGTTMRACYLEGRFCTGFDVNSEYKNAFLVSCLEDFSESEAKDLSAEEV